MWAPMNPVTLKYSWGRQSLVCPGHQSWKMGACYEGCHAVRHCLLPMLTCNGSVDGSSRLRLGDIIYTSGSATF